jgi:nitrogen-specific signal transduction histidine kinase
MLGRSFLSAGGNGAAIIRRMLDINHRMVVEQHGGAIHYTSQPSDIRFQVRLPVDASIDGAASRNVVRLREVG